MAQKTDQAGNNAGTAEIDPTFVLAPVGSVASVSAPAAEDIGMINTTTNISSRSSRRSTSTVAAQKLSAVAELRRRQLQRDTELELKRREVEELELQATLAEIDASSSHKGSVSNSLERTRLWAEDVSNHPVDFIAPIATQDAPPLQSAALPSSNMATYTAPLPLNVHTRSLTAHFVPPVAQAAIPPQTAELLGSNAAGNIPASGEPPCSSDIAQLAKAICSLTGTKPDPLPIFNGCYKDWLTFKSAFFRTQTKFSPTQNLTRLAEALRGPARESVACLLNATEDPGEIMHMLEQSYARPEIVVAQEVAALRALHRVTTPEQLNSFAIKVRNCVALMKALNQEQYLHSPEILRCVLTKLNDLIKSRFADYAADTHVDMRSKLETLSMFLVREADRQIKFSFVPDFTIAPTSSNNIPRAPVALPPRREIIHLATSKQTPPSNCCYCGSTHNIKLCKRFAVLPVEDRWRWVRENRVCFRCLKGEAHRWNACKAKRCGINGCARRHHALLHGCAPTSTETQADVPSTTLSANTCLSAPSPLAPTMNSSNSPTTPQTTILPAPKANCDSPKTGLVNNTVCNITDHSPAQPRPRAVLKVLPVVVRGAVSEFATYALLDDGSTATLIDADVARMIGAQETHSEPTVIEGIGGMAKQVTVGFSSFHIRGRDLTDEYLVTNARSIESLGICSQTVDRADLDKYAHLSKDLIELLTYDDAKPTILVGAGDWHLSLAREVRCGKSTQPAATRTLLGWTLHGCMSSKTNPVDFVNYACDSTPDTDFDSIEALLREQYRLDCLGICKLPPKNSEEDQRAIDIVDATARRLPSGRFEVGLPWRHSQPVITPDSYPQAFSRFKSLERQFAKDAAFATAYKDFVNGIIKKGYAEECSPDTYYKEHKSNSNTNNIRWYLPHFGVYHPQKKKIRVVHDAAATTKGVSLNSMLLVGPDLLQPLLGILFRFREGKIAVTGDIREMFPQVSIREQDRDAQRFLWRDTVNPSPVAPVNPSVGTSSALPPIKEFRMCAMIFGASCSPFIALHIKNKNALEMYATYPEATQEIITNHYMDDYVCSFDDEVVASKVIRDVFMVHKACCFEMRAWLSNDKNVLSSIPRELWAHPDADTALPSDAGALGIKWNPNTDSLAIRSESFNLLAERKVTKRIVLSAVMKVYDPLGFFTPITIKGRIMIQNLWREGFGWDDQLPAKHESVWTDFQKDIDAAASIRLPRHYGFDKTSFEQPTDVQLHMFADASEQAYACVGYWRFCYGGDRFKLALIASKARVTPLKPVTTPRLELQAALIALRLASTIICSHRRKPSSTTFWTDSSTVLKWIRGDARRYKPFVAHRVGEILENSNVSDWRWLPGDLNVADEATRPNCTLLNASHRWFAGPSFLLSAPKEWPEEPTSHEVAPPPDMKELVGFLVSEPPHGLTELVPDASRFSVWLRLLRAAACVLLAARKFWLLVRQTIPQNSKMFSTSPNVISASDILNAENMVLLKAQSESFREEIFALKHSKPLPKTSRLTTMSVKIQHDLLMLDSRDTTQSRILLDDRHHIVRLLVSHYHKKTAHGFSELVLNEIRARFWLLRGRRAIKTIVAGCRDCARRRKQPSIPVTGNLPPERLQHGTRPFFNVGLDYFGAVEVSIGRRREKRYVALYTCLVTRALHLEIVASLSTDSALMSLRRFIARRGTPAKIISDNGTAFVGASRELKVLFAQPLRDFAANNAITWEVVDKVQWLFIPPAAPFIGGAWERMVRTVKTALRATLRNKAPKEEVFQTLLMESESLVNSRPLTYVVSSADAPQAITPFNFLIGSTSNSNWLSGELSDSDLVRRADWRRVLRLADHFWTRWVKEYLPTLLKRPARGSITDFAEGDVVVVADPTLPRGLWPLGRVTRTYPGEDGVVRVADVATQAGILKRPARKLVHLLPAHQSVTTP